jgi:hypothetical protein
MTLRLTPMNLARAYEYLRATSPLDELNLPPASKVKFSVKRYRDRFSHMQGYRRSTEVEIAISERLVGSTFMLMASMAHEQIHLYQHINRSETPKTQHNAEFDEIADRVCIAHGFDRKSF